MITSRFNRLRARDGQIRTITEIAKSTGIARATLTNLAANDFAGTQIKTINTLCKYFGCGVGDLLEYIPEEAG